MVTPALLARGHKETCLFVNNHGPACACDGTEDDTPEGAARRRQIEAALEFAGFVGGRSANRVVIWPAASFTLRLDGEQAILLGKIISGWQFLWMKGYMTIAESGSFGTPEACLAGIWREMAQQHNQRHQLLIENARLRG